MTRLRQRMLEDLQIRNRSPKTQAAYVNAVAQFAKYFGKSPEELGPEKIHDWQLHLTQVRRVSWSTFNLYMSALRFCYRVTLNRPDVVEQIPYAKRPRQLPRVLSRAEVDALLRATHNGKHRALLTTMYATGLRVSEAVSLKVDDLDDAREVVHVRRGKGYKQRQVPYPELLRELLQAYRTVFAPNHWLLPGQRTERPLPTRPVSRVCRAAGCRAGIGPVRPHTLRHSFATHLLEDGVDIRVLQTLMGHARFETTMRYLHVSTRVIADVPSLLDKLSR